MLKQFFYAWERHLASVTTDRVVRPFEWGLDWIPQNGHRPAPSDVGGPAPSNIEGPSILPSETLGDWVSNVMADTDAFFTPPPTDEYELTAPSRDGDQILRFPSALTTPQPENNTVYCRYFPARGTQAPAARASSRGPQRGSRVGVAVASPFSRAVGDPTPDRCCFARTRSTAAAGAERRTGERAAALSQERRGWGPGAVNDVGPREHKKKRAAAVLVLPQWNADPSGHAGLCRLLAWSGLSALRLSLPYHDRRMPPELQRADYIVSANIARTVQVCRQAVLDARRAIAWLAAQGYDRIGILGTSLGSCLALLTTAHEPLIRAEALNHISPHFADVVWRGISTRHVRDGLDGHIELDLLRTLWKPISPRWYLERVRDRRTLLVYARYDLTFPVDLSEDLVREFRERAIPHEVAVLRCGHYSTGKSLFKFVDGWVLTRFLKRALERSA